MLFSAPIVRRAAVGAMGAGALAGVMYFGGSPIAAAQPPPPPPPGCSAADFSGVASNVSAASSAYLFTHPDVNAFFTRLHGQPREQIHAQVVDYLNANPQIQAEMSGIRQPLVDLKNRCGFTPDGLNTPGETP